MQLGPQTTKTIIIFWACLSVGKLKVGNRHQMSVIQSDNSTCSSDEAILGQAPDKLLVGNTGQVGFLCTVVSEINWH